MLLVLALAQAAAPARPPVGEWRGSVDAAGDCRTVRSSGNRAADAAGCRALEACFQNVRETDPGAAERRTLAKCLTDRRAAALRQGRPHRSRP